MYITDAVLDNEGEYRKTSDFDTQKAMGELTERILESRTATNALYGWT